MLTNEIEEKLKEERHYSFVCGCDEAGRGPLCGPVVAAACILPPNFSIEGLNDSKKLSAKKREKIFDQICNTAVSYCIAQSTVEEINQINILEASLLAMRRAIDGLYPNAQAALIDGNVSRGFSIPAHAIIQGDAKVPSIAAASILAKVTRDRLCLILDKLYPQYQISKHKGYGTPAHKKLLFDYGPAPIYRTRFIRFLNPDLPDEETAASPEAISLAYDPISWAFPTDAKPYTFEYQGKIPSYILKFKHGEVQYENF